MEICGCDKNNQRIYIFGRSSKSSADDLKAHAGGMKQFTKDIVNATKADVLKFHKELKGRK